MRRGRHLSVRGYLFALVAVFAGVAVSLAVYDRSQSVANARRITAERVGFQAELAAGEIDHGVDTAIATVAQLAANPSITALVEPSPSCQLSFSTPGHIDIVRADGAVLCSSSTPPGSHAGADWLANVGASPIAHGPVLDPTTGKQSLLIATPLPQGGAVAIFLELDGVPEQLHERFGGPLDADFAISPEASTSTPDRIAGRARVKTIGWTVAASVPTSVATREVDALNRRELLFLVTGLLVLGAAAWIVYRGLARPIHRLDSWVGVAMSGEVTAPPTSGPAELVSLAKTFETMSRSVATELEARFQAELEARSSADSYRLLFDSNPQPMWVHDRMSGAIVDANRAMIERFGWSRGELLGMNVADVLPADDENDLAARLRDSEPLERFGPVRLNDRLGVDVDCEISSTVLDPLGANSRLVIAEDVTSHLQTQRMLRRTDRMESLGHLAGGMAHDFNNALAVMLNYAEFATEALATAAEEDPARWSAVLRDVEGISFAGQRAAGLTSQLLSFARGEPAATSTVDLNVVVSELGDMLVRTIGEQIDLRVALSPDIGHLRADRGQLEQIIVNLAVNARDAMPDGGSLSIETSAVEVDEHNTAARPDLAPGLHIRLRVTDTGAGMDAATLEQALEPFFTTKPRGSGTGLGLATVYGIVIGFGGAIQLYSEPGLGTSVSIMLPVGSGSSIEDVQPVAPAVRGRGETVLVIDDDDAVRKVVERILDRSGFQVLSTANAHEALVLATERPGDIDLVLSDVVMPGMLGTELVRRLRLEQPAMRVLLMSGYAPPVLPDGGSFEDGILLVDKPFSAASLLQKVSEALGHS